MAKKSYAFFGEEKRGIFYWITATFFVLIWLLPIFASVLTSFKTLAEINSGKYWSLPEKFSFQNFFEAYTSGKFSSYLLNSIVITVPSVVLILFFSSLGGFALSKMNFKYSKLITLIFVAGMLLPFQILLIPVFYLSSHVLHIYDTRFGVILFHVAFQLGFGTFFMKNFIQTLPHGIIEAARLDGCSEFKIFTSIVFPLTTPAIAALSTLLFTWIWNDYLWSLILLQSDSLKPITAGLQNLNGQWVASIHLQNAGALLAALPPLALFLFLQKHFVNGLTLGSGK
jgi:multiple sugar transport system permease protein